MDKKAAFLKDEVRYGFMVPTAIKQAWAGSLFVLSEIDRICRKYGINYFAEWGTLLGAVRHGGFVPWDDDLDIGMLREDYRRFREVADMELPEGFAVQDYARQQDYWQFVVRITGSRKICFDEEYLNRHNNFPYISSVDIFVRDYIYRDSEKEQARRDKVLRLLAEAEALIEKKKDDVRCVELYRRAEELMAETRPEEADEIGQMYPWILKGGRGLDKKVYESFIRLPFEDTTMPVPARYVEFLGHHYPDFMKVYKIWGGHGYPFFESQKAGLEAAAGTKLPAFSYSEDMSVRAEDPESMSVAEMAGECLLQLKALSEAPDENYYADCQQTAADLGNLTEQVYGPDSRAGKTLVPVLEAYCEALYIAASEGKGRVVETDAVEEAVRKAFACREEVLFVCCGASEFEDMREFYEEEKAGADVYVVRPPVFKKDALGRAADGEDISDDPQDAELVSWERYYTALRKPARIYIQWPYDNENPALAFPAAFHARELQKYTGELIFIAPRKIRDFEAEEKNDVYNMKHYVTAPGVIYADRVIVRSSTLKERYAEALMAFCGRDMSAKIEVRGDKEGKAREGKKQLLYLLGYNECAECGEKLKEAVLGRLKLLKESEGNLEYALALYPGDEELWPEEILKLVKESGVCVREVREEDYDAYYGSPSPLALSFIMAKKPVMIADHSLTLNNDL